MSNLMSSLKVEVKSESLSPSTLTENSGSGSNTPTSSYPNTPTGTVQNDRIPSPSLSPTMHLKILDQQPRSYSDLMRGIAAKYTNSASVPNNYYSVNKTGSQAEYRYPSFKPGISQYGNILTPMMDNSGASQCHPGNKESQANQKQTLNSHDPPLFSYRVNPFSPNMYTQSNPDLATTQALLHMVRTSNIQASIQANQQHEPKSKRGMENPLDLTKRGGSKRMKDSSTNPRKRNSPRKYSAFVPPPTPQISLEPWPVPESTLQVCVPQCNELVDCAEHANAESVSRWTIDDVRNFVTSIDLCAEYAENFREQNIDGISLPLLTEEHLRTTINMKLGPALKFRAILAKKIGHCAICMHCLHCHNKFQHRAMPPMKTSTVASESPA